MENFNRKVAGMTDKLIELDPNDFNTPGHYEELNELDEAYPGDETHCAVGRYCIGLRDYGGGRVYPAIIATYLAEDPDTGYERGAWATCFYWESTGPVLDGKPTAICEDCMALFSFDSFDWYKARNDDGGAVLSDPVGEPMLEGDVVEVAWTVGVNDRHNFFAHLATYAPDHGMNWERELGVFPTVLDALTAVGEWASEYEKDLDRVEAHLDSIYQDPVA